MIMCSIAMFFLFFEKPFLYDNNHYNHHYYDCCCNFFPSDSTLADLEKRLIGAFESFSKTELAMILNHLTMMFFYRIDFILKRPIFGNGKIYYLGFYNFSGQISHNYFLEIGFNYGLLTLILYERFTLYSIFKMFKN